MCPNSAEDWYAVDVAEQGSVRLRVQGADVRCELRSPDGGRLLQACRDEAPDLRSAARTGLSRGRFRLRIHGEPPPEGNRYRLELEVAP